jgi:hypothetical protein
MLGVGIAPLVLIAMFALAVRLALDGPVQSRLDAPPQAHPAAA